MNSRLTECNNEKNVLNSSLTDCNGSSDLYIAYAIQDSNEVTFNWSVSDRIFYNSNATYGIEHVSMNQKETDGTFSKWSFSLNPSRPNENIDTAPSGNNSIGVIKKSRVFCIVNGTVIYSEYVNVNHISITKIAKNGNSLVVDWSVSSAFDNLYQSQNYKYIVQITDNLNQNYSFDISRNFTNSAYKKSGQITLSSPPSTLKTIRIFLFNKTDSATITTSRYYSFQTNWLESSTSQVLTGEGRQFLNTNSGNNWLKNSNWLIGEGGNNWLIGEGGKPWLRSTEGNNWLIGTNGNNWLIGEGGKTWLRSSDGNKWLIGISGMNWLIGEGGKTWLRSADGNNWLIGTNGKNWLNGDFGKAWLRSADGSNWLIGEGGKSWLIGEAGKTWLRSADGSNWLIGTNGKNWLNTSDGQKWLTG